jgi:hypothetical protein
MNIFNLTEEYLQLMNEIEENEGELTEELAEKLYVNSENVETKVKAFAAIKRSAEADMLTIENEIARLNILLSSKAKVAECMKAIVLEVTKVFGETGKSGNKKLTYDTLKVWTVNNQSMLFANEEEFDNEQYTRKVTTNKFTTEEAARIADINPATTFNKVILKSELKAALKNNEIIPNVILVDKPYVVIK